MIWPKVWKSPDGESLAVQWVEEGPIFEVCCDHDGECEVNTVPRGWIEMVVAW